MRASWVAKIASLGFLWGTLLKESYALSPSFARNPVCRQSQPPTLTRLASGGTEDADGDDASMTEVEVIGRVERAWDPLMISQYKGARAGWNKKSQYYSLVQMQMSQRGNPYPVFVREKKKEAGGFDPVKFAFAFTEALFRSTEYRRGEPPLYVSQYRGSRAGGRPMGNYYGQAYEPIAKEKAEADMAATFDAEADSLATFLREAKFRSKIPPGKADAEARFMRERGYVSNIEWTDFLERSRAQQLKKAESAQASRLASRDGFFTRSTALQLAKSAARRTTQPVVPEIAPPDEAATSSTASNAGQEEVSGDTLSFISTPYISNVAAAPKSASPVAADREPVTPGEPLTFISAYGGRKAGWSAASYYYRAAAAVAGPPLEFVSAYGGQKAGWRPGGSPYYPPPRSPVDERLLLRVAQAASRAPRAAAAAAAPVAAPRRPVAPGAPLPFVSAYGGRMAGGRAGTAYYKTPGRAAAAPASSAPGFHSVVREVLPPAAAASGAGKNAAAGQTADSDFLARSRALQLARAQGKRPAAPAPPVPGETLTFLSTSYVSSVAGAPARAAPEAEPTAEPEPVAEPAPPAAAAAAPQPLPPLANVPLMALGSDFFVRSSELQLRKAGARVPEGGAPPGEGGGRGADPFFERSRALQLAKALQGRAGAPKKAAAAAAVAAGEPEVTPLLRVRMGGAKYFLPEKEARRLVATGLAEPAGEDAGDDDDGRVLLVRLGGQALYVPRAQGEALIARGVAEAV